MVSQYGPDLLQLGLHILMPVPLDTVVNYIVEDGNLIANRQWSSEEASQSSTWHELHAIRSVLESFRNKLQDKRIRWFTDNQNVIRIILHGSSKSALQVEALAIFSICVRNHIRMEPEWVSREQNQLADYFQMAQITK